MAPPHPVMTGLQLTIEYPLVTRSLPVAMDTAAKLQSHVKCQRILSERPSREGIARDSCVPETWTP